MMRKILAFAVFAIAMWSCQGGPDAKHAYAIKNMQAAQKAVSNGDTAYALDIYRQVIATIADSSAYAAVAPQVVRAMECLTYLECEAGNPQAAIQWFEELKKHPTSLVRATSWRDLHTYLAMLYATADDMERAEQCMGAALELPMIGADADYRYYRDYVQASRIFIGNDARRPEITGWLEKALKHAEHCDSLPDMSYARSMLGTMYFWDGRIGDSFAMMNDNLKDVQEKRDTIGIIMALNTLTNLHNVFRLYEIANGYASQAIAIAEKAGMSNSVTVSDAYMLKIGAICNTVPDSVAYYVALAEDNCRNRPYVMGQEDIDYAAANHIIMQLSDAQLPDSTRRSMRGEAEMRLRRYVANVAPIKRAGAYSQLSRLYMAENPAKAEAMLDSMYRYQHLVEGIPMSTKEVTLFAIEHYLQTGNTAKLVQYVRDLVESRAMENDNRTEQQLVENIIQLRTAQAEARVEQLQLEVRIKNQRTVIIISVTVAALLLLIVLFMAYRYRQSRHLQKISQEKSTLEEKLTTEVEKTEATKKELEHIVSDLDNRRTIELLTPDVLKKRGELEFQKRFHLLYPAFSRNIKEKGVELSRREATLCMLIVLGHSNPDIAVILNIERKSVIVARYRLRLKLGLAEDMPLDDFLKTAAY